MKALSLTLFALLLIFNTAQAKIFRTPTLDSSDNINYQIDACLFGPRYKNSKCSKAANKIVADYFCLFKGYGASIGNSWSSKPNTAAWKAVESENSDNIKQSMNWQLKTGGFRFDWIECGVVSNN